MADEVVSALSKAFVSGGLFLTTVVLAVISCWQKSVRARRTLLVAALIVLLASAGLAVWALRQTAGSPVVPDG